MNVCSNYLYEERMNLLKLPKKINIEFLLNFLTLIFPPKDILIHILKLLKFNKNKILRINIIL